jgi:hypothetical protein
VEINPNCRSPMCNCTSEGACNARSAARAMMCNCTLQAPAASSGCLIPVSVTNSLFPVSSLQQLVCSFDGTTILIRSVRSAMQILRDRGGRGHFRKKAILSPAGRWIFPGGLFAPRPVGVHQQQASGRRPRSVSGARHCEFNSLSMRTKRAVGLEGR